MQLFLHIVVCFARRHKNVLVSSRYVYEVLILIIVQTELLSLSSHWTMP